MTKLTVSDRNAEELEILKEDFDINMDRREMVAQLYRFNRNLHRYGIALLVLGIVILGVELGIYPFIAGHF